MRQKLVTKQLVITLLLTPEQRHVARNEGAASRDQLYFAREVKPTVVPRGLARILLLASVVGNGSEPAGVQILVSIPHEFVDRVRHIDASYGPESLPQGLVVLFPRVGVCAARRHQGDWRMFDCNVRSKDALPLILETTRTQWACIGLGFIGHCANRRASVAYPKFGRQTDKKGRSKKIADARRQAT